jgi:hypothetical protein
MRYPGEVYVLPPDDRPGGDPKFRRHVLLTQVAAGTRCATAAFASTSGLDAGFGAAYHLLNPFKGTYRSTGFNEPVFIYLSRLVPVDVADLTEPVGRLIDDMVPVRDCLPTALGFGTGTGVGTGAAAGSWRGHVLRFSPELELELETPFGVSLTDPGYGRSHRFHIVVPMYDAVASQADALDVIINAPWASNLGFATPSIWLPVRLQPVQGAPTATGPTPSGDVALRGTHP